jgi:putative membrane protein
MTAIHFLFGAMTGAVYGATAEFAPLVTAGYGSAFGVVLQLMTHETLVPATGLDKPAMEQPLREHTSELLTHVVYGLATEGVRRAVRARLTP